MEIVDGRVIFIGRPLIRPCNMMSSSESSCIYTVPPCAYGPQHSTNSTVDCTDPPVFLTSLLPFLHYFSYSSSLSNSKLNKLPDGAIKSDTFTSEGL